MHKRTLQALQRQSQVFQQQENADLLYTVNYAAELDTDTIISSEWLQNTGTGSITSESNTTNTASARIKGNIGKQRITNKITTASGNIHERQVIIKVLPNTDRLGDDYFYWGRRGF